MAARDREAMFWSVRFERPAGEPRVAVEAQLATKQDVQGLILLLGEMVRLVPDAPGTEAEPVARWTEPERKVMFPDPDDHVKR
jgi:hypothetical protein